MPDWIDQGETLTANWLILGCYRFGAYLMAVFLDDPAWIAFWFC